MNKFLEDLRVFQHRAGAKMVAVERLSLSVGFEKRLLETLKERLVMDIGSGIVDEYAGLNIADGIDMAVASSSGNTSGNKLSVVLEVDGEYFFSAFPSSDFSYSVIHIFTLFGIKQELRGSVVSNRHIMEIPSISYAL